MTALRYLGLIDDEGRLRDEFSTVLHAGEDRDKEQLRGIILTAYAPIFGDLDLSRATPNQIDERFEQYGVTGDVKRKCLTFFLSAAQELEIPLSTLVHERARTVRRSPRARRERPPTPTSSRNGEPPPQDIPPSQYVDPLQAVATNLPLIFDPAEMDTEVQQAWVKLFTWVKVQTRKRK